MTDAKEAAKRIHNAPVAKSDEKTFDQLQREFLIERKRLISLTRPQYKPEPLYPLASAEDIDKSGREKLMEAVHLPLPELRRRPNPIPIGRVNLRPKIAVGIKKNLKQRIQEAVDREEARRREELFGGKNGG